MLGTLQTTIRRKSQPIHLITRVEELALRERIEWVPRLRVELRSQVFQTRAVTTLATSAFVDLEGVEPSTILYKSIVMTV